MSCPTIVATATHITNGVTSVDCQKQVRSWRLLRSLMELLIPTCIRPFIEPEEIKHESYFQTYYPKPAYTSSSAITGNCSSSNSVLSMPLWTMYYNGRKVGYAVKRGSSKADIDALRLMSSIVVGAGIMNGKQVDNDGELMYLRAKFDRVHGSSDSESFHLIDPDDNIGHGLSIFFFRSP
ncbi:hypothetical protein like AT5G65340 [Hibiscus trionum]|uniref:Uncharacterized protein n=1 Tax=Hibiscus trionum TaxID=183268 RepID=A0A9W7JCD9_HIBTR|nr:hypothetical protein like AT5G65340 [Hibiscus trionum]